MRKLYRIYYTTYSEEEHEKVLEALRRFGEVRYVPSSLLREFRFVELKLEEAGKEEEIRAVVAAIVGERVKVDWIDASR